MFCNLSTFIHFYVYSNYTFTLVWYAISNLDCNCNIIFGKVEINIQLLNSNFILNFLNTPLYFMKRQFSNIITSEVIFSILKLQIVKILNLIISGINFFHKFPFFLSQNWIWMALFFQSVSGLRKSEIF